MSDEIFEKMNKIANRYIKAYKTDFTNYDVDKYEKSMNGTEFVWIVRPYGTHFLNVPKQFQMLFGPLTNEQLEIEQNLVHDVIDFYDDNKNRFYYVIKGKSIKKVSKQFCLDLIRI